MRSSVVPRPYSALMILDLVGHEFSAPLAALDRWSMRFDRPLEPCPNCGGLLSDAHLEAADAGLIDPACPGCGVVLAA